MKTRTYRVDRAREYHQAGPNDLVKLLPVPGGHPIFVLKWVLEVVVWCLVHSEFLHLSGPTGTAKSSLLEALARVGRNFAAVCGYLGFPVRPLKVYPIEMATFESPGELYYRRALDGGKTFDEYSKIIQVISAVATAGDEAYHTLWLRELGRVHSSAVQGGLLDLMQKADVILPDGRRLDGTRIGWVADSNYQVDDEATHTLVTFDDALKRRFGVHVTLDYLNADQEVDVLLHLLAEATKGRKPRRRSGPVEAAVVVKLGRLLRQRRSQGNLLSVPPPTLYGFVAALRMFQDMPQLDLPSIARVTVLGNASPEDRDGANALINEVFGLQSDEDQDDPTAAGKLL